MKRDASAKPPVAYIPKKSHPWRRTAACHTNKSYQATQKPKGKDRTP